MASLPADLSTQTNTQIDSLIKTMIDYYNSHNNSFSADATGSSYASYIPNMVAQLQTMVGANPSTDLQEIVQEDTQIDLDIIQAKEDLSVAKARVDSLRNTNKQSYYESWFPLNRPLRTSSQLIILSLGIFFFVLSFFILVHSAGFSISINNHWTTDTGVESPFITKLRYLFPFGYGSTLLFLGVIIIAVVGYLRKA